MLYNQVHCPVSLESNPAFDSLSEDGNSSVNEYYREHKHTVTMTNNGPPIPPRSKPPTPPPYNAAVKRGMSPIQTTSVPKCAGSCSCPYCPIKNGIPLNYYASMMTGSSNDLIFCPVSKQPREDFATNSSASNSPRNSAMLYRCDSGASDQYSSARSQLSQNQNSRPPIIREFNRPGQNFMPGEENFRPMSPASSEISSSVLSDSHSECYGVAPLNAGNYSPMLSMHAMSSNPGFAVLPSKKQLPPTYLKSVQENSNTSKYGPGTSAQQPPPIPPKKAPPPYAPPLPPGVGVGNESPFDRQRTPNRDQSYNSPSKRSSGGSSVGGASLKSGDELSSTLKNSLSVNSFTAFDQQLAITSSSNKNDDDYAMDYVTLQKVQQNISVFNAAGPSTASSTNQDRGVASPPSSASRDSVNRDTGAYSASSSGGSQKKVKKQSANAYKFFMEQHMENVMSFPLQREKRRNQVEKESNSLPSSDKDQMLGNFNKHESDLLRRRRSKVSKDDFREIDQLGIGGFGEVKLVRSIEDGQLYAMKVLNKAHILKKNQAGHVRAERDILAQADNEWVVKLFLSFQDKHNLYLVMEYIPGGDLMSLLIKKDYFPEPMAKFYTAEMILAIEYVHELGFIHRDIKPDNILIDKDGHIKLTDFGLCTGFKWTHSSKYYQNGRVQHDATFEMDDEEWEKLVQQECNCCHSTNGTGSELLGGGDTVGDHNSSCPNSNRVKPLDRYKRLQRHRCLAHSLVGTPNYIAPELLMKVPYDKSCDWWSVGVILYEMVLGRPPFCAETPADTQYRVLNWKKYLRIPRDLVPISPNCIDFIQHICKDQRNRLGSRSVQELKGHPFLADLPFEDLRRSVSPYIPEIKHDLDTQHFQSEDGHLMTKPVNNSDYQPDHTLKHPDHAFYEFTYRRPPMPNVNSNWDPRRSPELSGIGKIPKSKSMGSGLTSKLFKSSTNLTDLESSKESEADDIESSVKHNSQKSGTSMAKKFLNGLRSFRSSENLVDENGSSGHEQTFLSGTSQGSNKSSSKKEKTKNSNANLMGNSSGQHHRRHSSELAMDTDSYQQSMDFESLAIRGHNGQFASPPTYQHNNATTYTTNPPFNNRFDPVRSNFKNGIANTSKLNTESHYQLSRPPPMNAPLRKNFPGTDIEFEQAQGSPQPQSSRAFPIPNLSSIQPIDSSTVKSGAAISQRNDDINSSSRSRNSGSVKSSQHQNAQSAAANARQRYEQNLNMFLRRQDFITGPASQSHQSPMIGAVYGSNTVSRGQRSKNGAAVSSRRYEEQEDNEECYV